MIYFTSDLHFGHNKPFLYEPRGYKNIEEHDQNIINNWNSLIKPEDEVYILGDLMLGNNNYGIECVRQLNGTLHLVYGNHDTDARKLLYQENNLHCLGYASVLKFDKYSFYLSHYPTLVGNFDEEGANKKKFCLCGHSHTQDKFLHFSLGKAYHVELDAHNNYPVSIFDVIQDIKDFSSLSAPSC